MTRRKMLEKLEAIKDEIAWDSGGELTDETRKAFDAASAKAHKLNEIAVAGLKWGD